MTVLCAKSVAIAGRLHPTDLAIARGERVAVIGPNGAGKTSLLRALALSGGATGAVTVSGTPLAQASPARRAKLIGYVPASRDAIWPIRVADAVADGGASPDEVAAWMNRLELQDLATRPLDALSTGERLRAFLARALAPAPPLVLADEPTANLDPYWRLRVLDLMAGAAADGAAVVLTIHDLDDALAWATRIVALDRGHLVADGPAGDLAGSDLFARLFRVTRSARGWRAL